MVERYVVSVAEETFATDFLLRIDSKKLFSV